MKYTDIKTFEDACKALGFTDPSIQVKGLAENRIPAFDAHFKLVIIAAALNNGWEPNWDDEDEYKHYPWFDMQGGFQLNFVLNCYSYSFVGSRLCFRSREVAQYAATQFLDLYKTYFCLP